MKVAVIHNEDMSRVINRLGMQNRELYNPKTVSLVTKALERGGHNVQIIDGNMHVIEQLQSFMPQVVEGERMGMVFNMAYGIQGESRYTHIPSIMEMLGIPYVGSTPAGHSLALDKVITKIIMQQHKVPTPRYWVFTSPYDDLSTVTFPAIVKPKMEAVSFGISVVEDKESLKESISSLLTEYNQPALVEEFIPGREFCVGMLGNYPPECFPLLEINLGNDPWAIQTEFDKKKRPFEKMCPAQIDSRLADQMIALSTKVFSALSLRDFARVDIRMDEDDNIHLLEVNSMASLGKTGSYVHAAKVAGYDYGMLINKILDVAAMRYFSNTYVPKSGQPIKKGLMPHIKMRMFAKSKQNETERLLKNMVATNCYVRNVSGINALGEIITHQLDQLGFTCEQIAKNEVGNILFYTNTKDKQYDVMILSHLDNMVPFNIQQQFRTSEGKLYGTGIWTHKGGIATMILALRTLKYVKALNKLRIAILFTTDNSLHGTISSPHIAPTSQSSNYVLGLSGSSLDGTVVTSRSGNAVYSCEMQMIDSEDVGAVANANQAFCKFLSQITKLSDSSEGFVVALRNVSISSSISSFFAQSEGTVQVRFKDPLQVDAFDAKMHALQGKLKKAGVNVLVKGGIRRDPIDKGTESADLFSIAKEIGELLDIRILNEHRWSSTNLSYAVPIIGRLDGLGPIGDAPYAGKEFILRHSIADRAVFLAILMTRLGES